MFLHPILDNFTVDNRYAEFTDAGDGAWQELVPSLFTHSSMIEINTIDG